MEPSSTTNVPRMLQENVESPRNLSGQTCPKDTLQEKVDKVINPNFLSPNDSPEKYNLKLDTLSLKKSLSNDSLSPRSTFSFEIFQNSITGKNSVDLLTDQLSNTKCQSKELRFSECELTCDVAEKLFPAIASNHNFTTLSFRKGHLDESIFNVLGKALSSNKGTIKNFDLDEIQLSCHSLAVLINLLSNNPGAVLSLNNCYIQINDDDPADFQELLTKVINPSVNLRPLDIDLSKIKKDENKFWDADISKPLVIKLTNLKVNPSIYSRIISGILNSGIAELHIHKALFNSISKEITNKFSPPFAKLPPALLNERTKKLIKFFDVKFTATALASIIQELQYHKEYRLRLENCTINFDDKDGIRQFEKLLAKTNDGNGSPLLLELIDTTTNVDNGLADFIRAIMMGNTSHLHIQKCNVDQAAKKMSQALASGQCSLDTLQISEGEFNLVSFTSIADSIVQQNKFPHGLTTLIIEDSRLTSALASPIGKLIREAEKLTYLGFSKNQLGMGPTPFSRRRRSSGHIIPGPAAYKKEALEKIDENALENSVTIALTLKETPKSSSEKHLKAIDAISAAIVERGVNPNSQPLYLDLTANMLTAIDAKNLETALRKNLPPEENLSEEEKKLLSQKKPPVYVDARVNDLQDTQELSIQRILSTEGESPRSISIPHTKLPEDRSPRLEFSGNKMVSPRTMISPRRQEQVSPNALSKVKSFKRRTSSQEIVRNPANKKAPEEIMPSSL